MTSSTSKILRGTYHWSKDTGREYYVRPNGLAMRWDEYVALLDAQHEIQTTIKENH
jgi:hypothetical protein